MEGSCGPEFGHRSDTSSADGVSGGTVLLGGVSAPCAEKDASCDADGYQAEEGEGADEGGSVTATVGAGRSGGDELLQILGRRKGSYERLKCFVLFCNAM